MPGEGPAAIEEGRFQLDTRLSDLAIAAIRS
jgi:hypothetical protein